MDTLQETPAAPTQEAPAPSGGGLIPEPPPIVAGNTLDAAHPLQNPTVDMAGATLAQKADQTAAAAAEPQKSSWWDRIRGKSPIQATTTDLQGNPIGATSTPDHLNTSPDGTVTTGAVPGVPEEAHAAAEAAASMPKFDGSTEASQVETTTPSTEAASTDVAAAAAPATETTPVDPAPAEAPAPVDTTAEPAATETSTVDAVSVVEPAPAVVPTTPAEETSSATTNEAPAEAPAPAWSATPDAAAIAAPMTEPVVDAPTSIDAAPVVSEPTAPVEAPAASAWPATPDMAETAPSVGAPSTASTSEMTAPIAEPQVDTVPAAPVVPTFSTDALSATPAAVDTSAPAPLNIEVRPDQANEAPEPAAVDPLAVGTVAPEVPATPGTGPTNPNEAPSMPTSFEPPAAHADAPVFGAPTEAAPASAPAAEMTAPPSVTPTEAPATSAWPATPDMAAPAAAPVSQDSNILTFPGADAASTSGEIAAVDTKTDATDPTSSTGTPPPLAQAA